MRWVYVFIVLIVSASSAAAQGEPAPAPGYGIPSYPPQDFASAGYTTPNYSPPNYQQYGPYATAPQPAYSSPPSYAPANSMPASYGAPAPYGAPSYGAPNYSSAPTYPASYPPPTGAAYGPTMQAPQNGQPQAYMTSGGAGEVQRMPDISTEVTQEEIFTPPPAATAPDGAAPDGAADSAVEFEMGEPDPTSWWSHSYWDPWEGSVELGLSGTEGNSETFNVRAGLKAKHSTEFLERTLEITSIQKSANGVTTANTALIDGRVVWPLPQSRFNYFIHGLVEYDEFKAFDCRVSADTGLGYEWIQNDLTKLMSRAGISASQEIGGPNDSLNPELLLGGEYEHKFNDSHKVSAKVDFYPTIDDFSDFRLNSQAAWEIALSSDWGLSLKLSVIDRYDSTPSGAKANDLDYSTLLIWSF